MEETDRERNGETPEKGRADPVMDLSDWVQTLLLPILIGILAFVFLARIITVDGTSMVPTLHNGDRVVTSNLFYEPKPGDVVVLQTDSYGQDPLVKRVIAVAGQTVDIDFDLGIVYVDGEALDEPYIAEATHRPLDFTGPRTVPEGCIFVMGDNRNRSTDSRDDRIGMVDARCVIGRVLLVLIPARDEEGRRDWNRFGAVHG